MNKNTNNDKLYEPPLLQAYHNGDIDQFKTLIDQGENINCRAYDKQRLISHVIRNKKNISNNKEFFDLLIDKGADIGPDDKSRGLLSVAIIKQKDTYYARKLLENNLNVDSFGRYDTAPGDPLYYLDDGGTTPYGPPIFDALFTENIDYINLLVEYNFDVNIYDHLDRSVMEYFIGLTSFNKTESKKIFKILIDYGADLDMLHTDGINLLSTIIKNEEYHLIKILFEKSEKIDINQKDFTGTTALMYAVLNGDTNIVKFLIEKGANIDIYNKYGFNSLRMAVRDDQMDIFKLMLKKSANLVLPNKEDNNNTILHKLMYDACDYFPNKSSHEWFDKYYKIILNKHPELLSIKNDKGETPIDILKKKNEYTPARKKFFDKFKIKDNSYRIN